MLPTADSDTVVVVGIVGPDDGHTIVTDSTPDNHQLADTQTVPRFPPIVSTGREQWHLARPLNPG
jgi:hypothetical protein